MQSNLTEEKRELEREGASARGRRGARTFSILTVFALILGFFIAPLAAQSAGSENQVDFEVLQVDASGATGTAVIRPAADADGGELTIEIEGEEIEAATSQILNSSISTQVIMVVDDSENAEAITGFRNVQDAALAYLDGLGSRTQVMLVRAGGGRFETQATVPFTTNHDQVRSAINDLEPRGGAVTFNAIANSNSFFSTQGDGVRNIVAFVGSEGGNSTISPDITRGRLIGSSAGLTVVAPATTNLDISQFAQVADAVRGGTVFRGTADENMTVAARNAAAAQESYVVGTFPTDSIIDAVSEDGQGEDGTNDVIVSYGGDSERVRIVPGDTVFGAALDAPALIESSRFAILEGNTVALIAVALIVIAVLIFAFTMMSILFGSDNTLNSTLSVYGTQDDRTDEQKSADDAFAKNRNRIVEQVVERAEGAAEARGSLDVTATMLERAEIPLRVGEAFAVQAALVVVAFVLGFLLGGTNLLVGLLFAILAAIIPSMYVKHKVRQRAKTLEAQLPDTLNLLSSTLKAGYSFLQGMDAVGNEAEEPLAGEFRRTVNEARLGKDMDVALDDLADRVDSQDMLWAIVAIKIQREVGGNLAELLSTVADTMQSRSRLRGEVSALTAEGRISALVLTFLPLFVGIAMFFINRTYLSELWTTTPGIAAVIGAVISIAVGSAWMRKIIDIEL